jgi:chromosome segregation ATPase
MFKIVKNRTWDGLVQEVNTLRKKKATVETEIIAARDAWSTSENRARKLSQDNSMLRTKVNACADTKKYLRGKIDEQSAEIKKLKEQLTEAQFQLKVAKKEVEIPTASGVRKPAAAQPAAETPQKRTYKRKNNGK